MDSKSFNEAPLAGTFFKFTIPVVCAGLISVAYNMVDTYFIALTDRGYVGARRKFNDFPPFR